MTQNDSFENSNDDENRILNDKYSVILKQLAEFDRRVELRRYAELTFTSRNGFVYVKSMAFSPFQDRYTSPNLCFINYKDQPNRSSNDCLYKYRDPDFMILGGVWIWGDS